MSGRARLMDSDGTRACPNCGAPLDSGSLPDGPVDPLDGAAPCLGCGLLLDEGGDGRLELLRAERYGAMPALARHALRRAQGAVMWIRAGGRAG